MKGRVRDAFDKIQAEPELKDKTKAFLFYKTKGYTGRRRKVYHALAAACALALFLGIRWFFFLPTAEISIDINPSLELGINRMDQVISVKSGNEDGKILAESQNLKYTDYTVAVQRILEDEKIRILLKEDGVLAMGVIGPKSRQTEEILSELEQYTRGKRNMYCYRADQEEAKEARELGLSNGKYRAFLELRKLDPQIRPEQIRDMSMKEIRQLMEQLSGNNKEEKGTNRGGRAGNGKQSKR